MLFLAPIVWMPLSVVVGFHRAAVVANESPLCASRLRQKMRWSGPLVVLWLCTGTGFCLE